jgi:hypothetical protein
MAILPGSSQTGKEPEAMGGLAMPPGGVGLNQEPGLGVRRVMQLDNGSRIATQFARDRGLYARPAVGPVEYSEGNIKKSTALTGPAGYNQRNIPLPDSADDMSQAEYMMSLQQATPQSRMMMQKVVQNPSQNFLNTKLLQQDYPVLTHNMMNNLLALSKQKLQGKQK